MAAEGKSASNASASGGASGKLRVVIAGAGVAGLECALALADLAGERTNVTLLAAQEEFVYRPLAVREPFAFGATSRYPLAPIVRDAGAELVAENLARVDVEGRVAHTSSGASLPYDALVLAVGAEAKARYEHAITLDDRRMDELMHGLLQDVEGGYVRRLAFVTPGRAGWPLPIYEIAMMTAGRAYDAGLDVAATIVTPEEAPLAIFGSAVSERLTEVLRGAGIEVITSAYAEVPAAGEVVVNPGDRRLEVDRIVAMPELFGPAIPGLTSDTHGFYRVDPHGRLQDAGPVFVAGDATEFAVKQGGLASQQADAVAEAIAALAGVAIEPQPFHPVVDAVLFTDTKPLYLHARITGGHGFSSQISETPSEAQPASPDQPAGAKIASRYLTPYLSARQPVQG